MRYRNGAYPPRALGASVPRDVAVKIAQERDALAVELERVRTQLERARQQAAAAADVPAQEVEQMRASFAKERTQWAHERASLEDALVDAEASNHEANLALSEAQHKIEQTQREQEKLSQQAAQAQGLSGDLERMRRRQSEDLAQSNQRVQRDVISDFLELRDGLSMAHQYADPDNPWTQGIEQLIAQFDTIVTRQGLTLVGEVGEAFDPALHEAVDTQPGERPDLVAAVERPGYAFEDGTIARPARVVVTR